MKSGTADTETAIPTTRRTQKYTDELTVLTCGIKNRAQTSSGFVTPCGMAPQKNLTAAMVLGSVLWAGCTTDQGTEGGGVGGPDNGLGTDGGMVIGGGDIGESARANWGLLAGESMLFSTE